jgi:hypothetical protein
VPRQIPRLPLVAAVALAGSALLSGCAAGSHSPQYEEHTTTDFTNVNLPGGLTLDGGYISTPAKKGGKAVATFTVAVLTGNGGTITGVTSPVASSTSLGLLLPDGTATEVSSVSLQPSQSQVPVRVAVVLTGLTQALLPGYFYDVDVSLAQSATPVRLSFPVLRSGANPSGALIPGSVD